MSITPDGLSELWRYLESASKVERETKKVQTKAAALLGKINKYFMRLCGTNTQSLVHGARVFPRTLAINAHAQWLCATRTAFSGQSPPVFAILRQSLESAVYAFMMSNDHSLESVWINRTKSEKSKRRCRDSFSFRNGVRALNKAEEGIGDYVLHHYDWLIEFGAHPNLRSVINHVDFAQREDAVELTVTYVHHPQSLEVKRSLVACMECGIAIVIVAAMALPDDPVSKDIESNMDALNEQVQSFSKEDSV